MDVGGKLLTGAAATALLAVIGHYATADSFVSGLEQSAQTEMAAQGMEGVSVSFARDPLSRTAILDGDVADDVKQNALSAVLTIDGVSSARWKGEKITASTGSDDGETGAATDPATKAKITKCQGGVDKTIEGKKLSFKSGSAYVSPASNRLLDEIATSLKPCGGLAIAVGGHTDGNGDASVNKALSQERADRVRAGLVKRGISENLVTATGYGAEKPLAQGGGSAADAQNRRIEFKLQAAQNSSAEQGE